MDKRISRSEIAKYSGLTWKDYMFYSLGDFGICLVFQCANGLLTKYYNDCLLFNPVYVIIIFLIARIWDAVNDPLMGRLADRMKPNKRGKYKRWLFYMAAPFAISTVLMFAMPGGPAGSTAPWWQYVLAGFTYILFGMCMTAIQIPYGSLAGVVTLDAKERGKLSFTRGIFSSIGSLGFLAVKALAFKDDPSTGKHVSYVPLIVGVAILAFFTFVFLMICYKGSKERAIPKEVKHEKGSFKKAINRIVKNKATLSLCIITVIVMSGDTFTGVISVFLSMDFFHVQGFLVILPDLLNIFAIVFNIFFIPILMRKLGKKETVTLGLFFSSLIALGQFFIIFMDRNSGSYVPYLLYTLAKFFCGLGMGFYHALVWGLLADCCDDMQIKTGVKEDGTSYSIYFFFRKVGQCIAFVLGQVVLIAINYFTYTKEKLPLPIESQNMLYLLSTGISFACYLSGALLMLFWYPINKYKLEEIQDAKELLLEKENKEKEEAAKKEKALATK